MEKFIEKYNKWFPYCEKDNLIESMRADLILVDTRLSLFKEVYEKFVECEDDDEFTRYLNENTNFE